MSETGLAWTDEGSAGWQGLPIRPQRHHRGPPRRLHVRSGIAHRHASHRPWGQTLLPILLPVGLLPVLL